MKFQFKLISFFSLALIFLLISCKTKEKTGQSAEKAKIVIAMNKTACYGKCPVYSIDIYTDGTIMFEGKNFTEKIGNYTTNISKEKLNAIIKEFNNADFFNFENEYTSPSLDFPTTYITFNYNGKSKKIKDYDGSPKELKKLENRIDELRKLEGWEKVEKEAN